MKSNHYLAEIFEPVVTATAARFADRALMVAEDGEIRLYGTRIFYHENGARSVRHVVQKSRDDGRSFIEEDIADDDPGPRVRSPYSGDYLTLLEFTNPACGPDSCYCAASHWFPAQLSATHAKGVFVRRSKGGPDGLFTEEKVDDQPLQLQRLPLALRSRRRWIVAGQQQVDGWAHPVVLLSDDDGHTWRKRILEASPHFTVAYPHQGMRWANCGEEPVVAETASGRLIMLLRTAVDVHYQCFSDDGGETWTRPEPSIFYSVITMPGLYALSGGRLLVVWNNTTPLAELDHAAAQPELTEGECAGNGEDVFTNRDVLHAAISDDEGQTWRGFREIALNGHRNDCDWRRKGRMWTLLDKSVHQNQVIELPGNKVLVHYGQHPVASRVAIFDLAFLDVTERRATFDNGLEDWSTHLYYKSVSGNCRGGGHCSWNRRSGAQLMPSPDNPEEEALLIGRHPDRRLFSDREGAVWNFPGARAGEITISLTVSPGSDGLRISLADRWINPCDEHIAEYADFSFVLGGHGTAGDVKLVIPRRRATLSLSFDLDQQTLVVKTDLGVMTTGATRTLPAPFGAAVQLSYLHLQTAAGAADEEGVYIHGCAMRAR